MCFSQVRQMLYSCVIFFLILFNLMMVFTLQLLDQHGITSFQSPHRVLPDAQNGSQFAVLVLPTLSTQPALLTVHTMQWVVSRCTASYSGWQWRGMGSFSTPRQPGTGCPCAWGSFFTAVVTCTCCAAVFQMSKTSQSPQLLPCRATILKSCQPHNTWAILNIFVCPLPGCCKVKRQGKSLKCLTVPLQGLSREPEHAVTCTPQWCLSHGREVPSVVLTVLSLPQGGDVQDPWPLAGVAASVRGHSTVLPRGAAVRNHRPVPSDRQLIGLGVLSDSLSARRTGSSTSLSCLLINSARGTFCLMISPWGVFKALLSENYLESTKIAALMLSCCPGESREVPVTQVEVTITYSSEKNNPCFGKRGIPASKWNGRCLSGIRDEHEERRYEGVSLYPRSAVENTCDASSEGIKQMGNSCPWALCCCFCSSPVGAASWPSRQQEYSDRHLLVKLLTPQLWNLVVAEFSEAGWDSTSVHLQTPAIISKMTLPE